VPISIPSALLITAALIAAPLTTPPGDACSLFTKEEAAEALGEAVSGPKAIAEMDGGQGAKVSGCEYTGSGINRIQLNLTRLPGVRCRCTDVRESEGDGLAGLVMSRAGTAKHETARYQGNGVRRSNRRSGD
jgi:hypothetical protein